MKFACFYSTLYTQMCLTCSHQCVKNVHSQGEFLRFCRTSWASAHFWSPASSIFSVLSPFQDPWYPNGRPGGAITHSANMHCLCFISRPENKSFPAWHTGHELIYMTGLSRSSLWVHHAFLKTMRITNAHAKLFRNTSCLTDLCMQCCLEPSLGASTFVDGHSDDVACIVRARHHTSHSLYVPLMLHTGLQVLESHATFDS